MRQQTSFSKDQFAHRFEIVEGGAESQSTQRFAHCGKHQLRLITQTEESLCAAELFSGLCDFQNLVSGHGMRAGLSRVAAKGAIPAVVAAEICKRKENFAGISDHATLEPVARFLCGRKKLRQVFVSGTNPAARGFAGERGVQFLT